MAKRKAPQSSSSAKKIKVQYGSLDGLPWKSVARPIETGLDGDDGVLALEEVDNVEVVYETGKEGGRVIQFNVGPFFFQSSGLIVEPMIHDVI